MRVVFFLTLAFTNFIYAVTISHSAVELDYRYEARFRSLVKEASAPVAKEAAEFHAAHLFGLFHSPEVSEESGYPAELIEGFAGTKHPTVRKAKAYSAPEDDYLWVRYEGSGQILLHQSTLKRWLGNREKGTFELPLLSDLPAIYADEGNELEFRDKRWEHCGDSHYRQAIDFSYFYNPFRCPELGKAPFATKTRFFVEKSDRLGLARDRRVPIETLHGPNGNGPLITFYFANGYNESPDPGAQTQQIHRDAGWKTYAYIESLFVKTHGFQKIDGLEELRSALGDDLDRLELLTPVSLTHDNQRRYFSTFVKRTQKGLFVARNALFDTRFEETSRPRRSFPKFWKEAWENGDFIYFGGHSGDGETLSLSNLLKTLDAVDLEQIHFQRHKTQMALIDSCSSYAHYQDMYFGKKPSTLHLMTHGLVSLFHLATPTIGATLEILLDTEGRTEPTWTSTLKEIEESTLGAHVSTFYEKPDREEMIRWFQTRKLHPTSLLNARVP